MVTPRCRLQQALGAAGDKYIARVPSGTAPEMPQEMLTLYGTSACHLCELAAALLVAADLPFDEVDISESDELFERYGLTIPVVRRADGAELNWPFDEEALVRFLA